MTIERIFEHYAAGTDGGHSERMSFNEFWEVVKDCGLTKSSSDTISAIEKESINSIYHYASELENATCKSDYEDELDEVEILPNAFIISLIEIVP